jgi:large subunit ribosomal protein L6
VPIPDKVKVERVGDDVTVTGPKGTLSKRLPSQIGMETGDGELRFVRSDEKKQTRALHGLSRALVANMVQGVTEGFSKDLEIEGVGYRADASKTKLTLVVGYSHPVEMPIPEGLSVRVEGTNRIRVEGANREQVGQFAADVRSVRPPEPYKGKGIRYAGEHVRRKVGKAGTA